AKAPAIALSDHLAVLIVKFAVIDLLDRAAGKTGLMLDQLLQPRLGRELIAEQHRPVPHGVDAGEHRVHARQSADVAAERAVEREDERRRRGDASLRLRPVLRVAPQRIVVADAVGPVTDVVARRFVTPWL